MNEKTELEQAPPNSLPDWHECQRILDNHDFRQRAAMGLEGSVLDTPPTTPEPTELHRFIYEYDDADPYRSAWFMHRLELVLNEARAASPSSKSTKEDDDGSPLKRLAFMRRIVDGLPWSLDKRELLHNIGWLEHDLASSSIKEDGDQAIYNSMAARYRRDRLKEDGERAEVNDDAEAIKRALESAIQRFGAGRLAAALVEAGADQNLQTLAEYASPPSPLGDTPDQQEQNHG